MQVKRLVALCVPLLWSAPVVVHAQDLERGRMLHENHCRMCHESIAYKRSGHIARNIEEVRAQVTRWQNNTDLRWSDEDIDNVAAYLAQRYYKFTPPPSK